MRRKASAVLIAACVVTGCSGGLVGGTPTMMLADPREVFGVFAHPAEPWDRVPDQLSIELDVTDSRKVGSWPGTDVYVVFTAPSTICLVTDASPPGGITGGSACGSFSEVASKGIGMLSINDPAEAQGVLLVPDNATATIDRGNFVGAGNGVIGIQTDTPTEGIAATLTFLDGRTSHLDLHVPG